MDVKPGRAVLLTGGAGFIGAHIAKALSEQGFHPIVFDNLSSGYAAAVQWGDFVSGDIRDFRRVRETLNASGAKAIIHLAGLIEVDRSVGRPDLFWEQNVGGTASLLAAARDCGIRRFVFSSSAAVYGQQPCASPGQPLAETVPCNPSSPYGDTKLACERMIASHARAFGFSAIALRYFNAGGADRAGQIGEAHDPETHLIPLAIAAAIGDGAPLTVFGADFPTPDGSCVRDYVHVSDVASAHMAALELSLADGAFDAFNVGVGRGWSVFEVIRAVEAASGRRLPFHVGPRRPGDPASLVADPSRARRRLGWSPKHSCLDEIARTAVAWHRSPRYGARGSVAGSENAVAA
jgi:UDP-glucose 4-epimerase/UDP-arabinose 4-epimerase